MFGDFAANRDVSLTIRAGERHALLGENGAGKSTLVKMIYGVLQPTEGRFFWNGQPVRVARPAEARALGVGMVFQHFSVFEALSVAENVALALPPQPMPALTRRIAQVSQEYGLAIDPDRAMHTLSVGEKQRVEIIRCLLQDPRLLIMDEPTSVLTPQEAEALFAILRRLSGEGRAILYISHRLEEVRALCDAATILRHGRVVARCDPREMSARALAELMVGEAVAWVEKPDAPPPGPVRLLLDHLSLPAPSEFAMALRDVSLEVRGGEIVGVAGVAGEGQTELAAALSGERRAPSPEMILLDGAPVGRMGPTERRLRGAAFAPEERNGHAAIGEMTLPENVILSHHRAEGVAKRGWIDFAAAASWARRVREAFDVRSGGAQPVAGSLSGGNLQKFVIGREILREPGVLIVNQPTWGVDAGAAALIRKALIDLAGRGAAVLVISQDLDEIFEIADRIAVLHKGRLSEARPAGAMTPEAVGLLMGGAHPEADPAADARGEAAA
ncbi:MAG: ABC transporter ATP-binding protein [Rubrimonas sp.]|uniref:ABC transporter ATP-binding protein n=1 Tax=Rubrimonas sp. TaxID=2036015 RepID=UPI002FDE2A58